MKTAIIMSGHVRTWDLIKDEQINAINDLYGNDIDWFVSVWDTSTVTKSYMIDYFLNKKINLIKLNWVDRKIYKDLPVYKFSKNTMIQLKQGGSGTFSSYITELSSLDKKKHEFSSGVIYERVIFTRPDVLFYYGSHSSKLENEFADEKIYESKKDFALQTRGDYREITFPVSCLNSDGLRIIGGMLSSDLFGMMAIDFLSSCVDDYLFKFRLRKTDIHSQIPIFLNKHLISLDHRYSEKGVNHETSVVGQVVRPSMDIDKIKQEYKNWDILKTRFTVGFCPNWSRGYDAESVIKNQLEWCIFRKIDFHDYFLEDFKL